MAEIDELRLALPGDTSDSWQRYLHLLERVFYWTHQSVLITDAELELPGPRILYVNPAFERQTGWASAEVIGRTPRLLQGAKTSRMVLDQLKACLREGRFFAGETVNYRRDGREFLVQWRIVPLRDNQGAVVAYLAFQNDVTDQAHAQARIRESQDLLALIFETAEIGICVTDADRRFVRVNPAYCRTYGYQASELVGQEFTKVLPPAIRDYAARIHDAFIAGSPESAGEWQVVRKDGEVRDILVTAGRLVYPDGQRFKVTTVTDITDRKRFAQNLGQIQRLDALGRLAGGLAHDFNNLLTAIMAHCSTGLVELQRDPQATKTAQTFSGIQSVAVQASTMVRQLMTLTGHQAINPYRAVNLDALIVDSHAIMRRVLPASIELIFETAVPTAVIEADPSQLTQVLLNLVLNAADAMPHGGRLTLRTQTVTMAAPAGPTAIRLPGNPGSDNARSPLASPQPGRYVALSVIDTGVGMTEEVRQQIFEPFFTTKATGRGTGLGLASVYGIVQNYGGYIEVISQPGAGTSFRILLPQIVVPPAGANPGTMTPLNPAAMAATAPDLSVAKPVAAPQLPAAERVAPSEISPRASQAEPPAPQLGNDPRRAVLLLLEDEDLVRELVCQVLRDQGFEVIEAANGPQALSLAAGYAGRIDLLISDLTLPQMSGFAVAQRLRLSRPEVGIIFTSGYSPDSANVRQAIASGESFLQKPYTTETLLAAVRSRLAAAKTP